VLVPLATPPQPDTVIAMTTAAAALMMVRCRFIGGSFVVHWGK